MNRIVFLIFAATLPLTSGLASAQEPSARERELEELIRKLSIKVEQLETRIDQIEGAKSAGTTEARVEQLEKSVETIKNTHPLTVDPEELARIREWVNDPLAMRPYWKDGLHFDSNDGSFDVKIGGRIHYEWAYFEEGEGLERRIGENFMNDSEVRRARIYMAGTFYDNVKLKMQYEFAGGDVDFKDVYIELNNLPYVGNLRMGQFKEPFSLEEMGSSNSETFIERSLVNALVPSRNAGILAHDVLAGGNMRWAAGVYRQTDSFGNGVGGRDYNLTMRVTGVPVYEDDGLKMLHLGISASHQNYENDMRRFRARPESNLAPYLADTGTFGAESGNLFGAEVAWVDGPFSMQSEYVHAFMEGNTRRYGNPQFWAASIQASYMLTGEHRPYEKSTGIFGVIRPKSNYDHERGGTGAWELAIRYAYLTLNDGNVRGGRLDTIGVALNWHLNPSTRMMWNYINADPSRGGNVDIFQWRMQLAF